MKTNVVKIRVAEPVREIASWKVRKDLSIDTIKAKNHIVLWRAGK